MAWDLSLRLGKMGDILTNFLIVVVAIISVIGAILSTQDNALYKQEKQGKQKKIHEKQNEFLEKENELKLREYEIQKREKELRTKQKLLQELQQLQQNESSINQINSKLNELLDEKSDIDKSTLSETEKYQLALNIYRRKYNKPNWLIGLEYERYVGYLFEQKGYKVTYNGALHGMEDHGRDLIAEITDEYSGQLMTYIIQCKRWSKNSIIHEKYIHQLHGSVASYYSCDAGNASTNRSASNVKGMFITTAKLSDYARECAKSLDITVEEGYKFDYKYPCIKCVVSRKGRKNIKAYYLPFDTDYDAMSILPQSGGFYVSTVQEAEDKGFRHFSTFIAVNSMSLTT